MKTLFVIAFLLTAQKGLSQQANFPIVTLYTESAPTHVFYDYNLRQDVVVQCVSAYPQKSRIPVCTIKTSNNCNGSYQVFIGHQPGLCYSMGMKTALDAVDKLVASGQCMRPLD